MTRINSSTAKAAVLKLKSFLLILSVALVARPAEANSQIGKKEVV